MQYLVPDKINITLDNVTSKSDADRQQKVSAGVSFNSNSRQSILPLNVTHLGEE